MHFFCAEICINFFFLTFSNKVLLKLKSLKKKNAWTEQDKTSSQANKHALEKKDKQCLIIIDNRRLELNKLFSISILWFI